MRRVFLPLSILALLGCACSADLREQSPRRPFQVICDILDGYPPLFRKDFVRELAEGLPSSDLAVFIVADVDPHPTSPLPSWKDLVDELLLHSQRDLLVDLLRDRRVNYVHYGVLAKILSEREDPEVFAILLAHSEPIREIPKDISDDRGVYLQEAARVLRHFLNRGPEEGQALKRLLDVLQGTYSGTARGTAALSLGASDRPEAVDALLRALQDKEPVSSPKGPPGETVATWAERSLKQIEKRTGKTLPRVSP